MKYYYTYKIILLKGSLAGKYYYGQHSTENLNDGYAGSGTILKSYYQKYDKIEHQTYIKEIIAFYLDREDLNLAEEALIGDKYNTDPYCLNCKAGGNSKGFSKEMLKHMSESRKGKRCGKDNPKYQGNKGKDNPMYGKHHTKEVCKKLSDFRKTRIGALSSRGESINQLTTDGKFIKTWSCAAEAVRELGLSKSAIGHIRQCVKGLRNTANGFKWELVDKNNIG